MPRFKARRKLHSFACEIIQGALQRSLRLSVFPKLLNLHTWRIQPIHLAVARAPQGPLCHVGSRHRRARPGRWFGVEQKNKIHPIDNFKGSKINASCRTQEKVQRLFSLKSWSSPQELPLVFCFADGNARLPLSAPEASPWQRAHLER